jgi:hypothetical protein
MTRFPRQGALCRSRGAPPAGVGARQYFSATIFATQPPSTEQDEAAPRRGWESGLGLEIRMEQHEAERVGTAKAEFQDRCLKPLGHPSNSLIRRDFPSRPVDAKAPARPLATRSPQHGDLLRRTSRRQRVRRCRQKWAAMALRDQVVPCACRGAMMVLKWSYPTTSGHAR